MARSSISTRLADACFYPADYDFETGAIVFAVSEPSCISRSLRVRAHDFPLENLWSVSSDQVSREISRRAQVPAINYLFHLPFCGSTLLTRYLENSTFLLRDPVVLDALFLRHEFKGTHRESPAKVRRTALKLLNRSVSGMPILIRTAGYYPEMLRPLVTSPTFRSALFLYASPRYYLSQVLKSPERRKHARLLLAKRRTYTRGKCGEPLEALTDAAVAALFWVLAVETVLELAAECRSERLKCLDAERFFTNRTGALAKVCAFLGIDKLGIESGRVHEIETTHAKFGQSFNEEQRLAGFGEATTEHSSEIDSALEFLDQLKLQNSLMDGLRRFNI